MTWQSTHHSFLVIKSIGLLEETQIGFGKITPFGETQREPLVLFLEDILNMEKDFLLGPVNQPAHLDFVMIQIKCVQLRR